MANSGNKLRDLAGPSGQSALITKRTIVPMILVSLLTAWLLVGCASASPIKGIWVMKAPHDGQGPTEPFWQSVNPRSTRVQARLRQGDRILVVLSISSKLDNSLTFSRYTIFSKETGQETAIGFPEDIMTWEPGQTGLMNLRNPWVVPNRPGTYELRMYINEKIVASAVFQVY